MAEPLTDKELAEFRRRVDGLHDMSLGTSMRVGWERRILATIADLQRELQEAEEELREHGRLKDELNQVLHPKGDGPTAPSWCDLIAYVAGDRQQAQEERDEAESQVAELVSREVDLRAERDAALAALGELGKRLRWLSNYEKNPPEITKDEFAYDRLLAWVKEQAADWAAEFVDAELSERRRT